MFYASELWQPQKEKMVASNIYIELLSKFSECRTCYRAGGIVMRWAWSAPLVGTVLTDLPNPGRGGQMPLRVRVPPSPPHTPIPRFHWPCITLEICWVNKTKKSLVTLGMPLYTSIVTHVPLIFFLKLSPNAYLGDNFANTLLFSVFTKGMSVRQSEKSLHTYDIWKYLSWGSSIRNVCTTFYVKYILHICTFI